MSRFVMIAGPLLGLLLTPGAHAAPRLWVEADIESPQVPVNVQATFILRFGHAVDVRSPRLDAPVARLAEIVPLGPVTSSEAVRDGLRYRVLERRFAVLPFASGELLLNAEVAGTTPAALPETGGRANFSLAATPVRLRVSPAAVATDWLPAYRLQVSASNATSPVLQVGDVWTRQLLIEAEGVDGSVIAPPRWPVTLDWSLQLDPPAVGHRVAGGRVIGYRRQTVHAQALHAGRLNYPELRLAWWHVPSGERRESALLATSVDVAAPAKAATATMQPRPGQNHETKAADPAARTGNTRRTMIWSAIAVVMVAVALVVDRHRRPAPRTLQLIWQRRRFWRQLNTACRDHDAPAARRALLAWAAACRLPARSLGALAEWADGRYAPLADAIAGLQVASYGPPVAPWNGRQLRAALRAAVGYRSCLAFAGLRLSSRPVTYR